MQRTECRDRLHRILQLELQCSERLAEALSAERRALLAGAAAAIESSLQAKLCEMSAFEQLEQERDAITKATGYANDPEGMEACIQWCDPQGTLRKTWGRLLERVRACDQSNRQNGADIEVRRRHTRQALEILRGQDTSVELYRPGGAAANGANPRALGKA